MINTIDILADGKLSAFTGTEETYLQPEIIIDTLDGLQQLLIKDQFGNYVKADTTITSIKGVPFAGTFADLETAIRDLALESNGLYNGGTGGGGGGGDASAANQLTQITELQTLNANNLPAEVTGFVTVTPLGIGGAFDSGVLDVNGRTQVQTEILASHDGTINISFCADSGGIDVVRSLSIPYSASGGYQFFAAPAFANYIKYEFLNTSGSVQTDFYYTTKFLTVGLSPQLLTTGAFIAPAMVTSLGRNIIVGQNTAGNFNNVSVVETTNSAGTTNNLQVVSGARPSQLAGRSAVRILADNNTAPVLLYTVTTLKTLYITDIILTIVNSGAVTGSLEIYDALTATGLPILPINAADPGSGGDSTLTTVTHTFSEPLPFTTGVFFDEAASTLTMSGILIGYEE